MNLCQAAGRWTTWCGILLSGLLVAGCRSPKPQFDDVPGVASPRTPAGAGVKPAPGNPAADTASATRPESNPGVIHVGDPLTVVFTDLPAVIPPFEVLVREDGTITLAENQQFKAAGKTAAALEKEIRDFYVPTYWAHATITIKAPTQCFFVGGEVKQPNRYPYLKPTTVLQAIQAAGDFTDFARKTRVRLARGAKVYIINCVEARKNPKLDLPVFADDSIYVPRKGWPWQR